MGAWMASPLAKTCKIELSVVCCSKFQREIKALVFLVKSFPSPAMSPPPPTPYLHTYPWTNLVFAGVFLPLAQTGHSQTSQLWTAHSLPWWLACSTSGQYDRCFHSVWRRTGTGQWPYCSLQEEDMMWGAQSAGSVGSRPKCLEMEAGWSALAYSSP